jgi:glutathione S-transferase
MLTLHHAPQSRSSRAIWLLEELGLPYAINYCDIRRRDGSGARDPANPHPDGKVPALEHEGELITESAAVFLYLTDLLPEAGLAPAAGSPGRGEYLTWLAWYQGDMESAMIAKFTGAVDANPKAREAYDAVVARLLGALERGPYLMGERFTAADILIGSAIGWGRQFFPESALLDAWHARLESRPARLRASERDSAPERAAA